MIPAIIFVLFSFSAVSAWPANTALTIFAVLPSSSSQEATVPPASPPEQKSPPSTPTPGPAPCPSNPQSGAAQPPPCQPSAARKKKKRRPRPAQAPPPAEGPSKTVVRNGSTTEPVVQLSQDVNQQQASREQQVTDQLLAQTASNLKTLAARQLTSGQLDTVTQIKTYMEQSRAAENEGDLQRAHNLALKANLLSADLVGH